MIATGARRRKRQDNIGQGTGGQNPTNEDIQMKRDTCIGIATADDTAFMDISTLRDNDNNAFSDVLPLCPQTKALLDLSPMFQENQFTTQPGDCYRSNDLYIPANVEAYQFASVCCYDANNNG